MKSSKPFKVVIVGAGVGGLFAAFQLLKRGISVDLYDHMSGVGKKFLVAGNGGLNLTHTENKDQFKKRYGNSESFFDSLLDDFSPEDTRSWCNELEVETFIGSSGRVFPKKFKAAEMLREWLKRLESYENFNLYLSHKLIKIQKDKELIFEFNSKKIVVENEYVIFSLGGGSWAKTGSNGLWIDFFKELNIKTYPLKAMNCGFECHWIKGFLKENERPFLKNIVISINEKSTRGEIMLTDYGIEGGAIYSLSLEIREEIERGGHANLSVDLLPDHSLEKINKTLERPRNKNSLSNFLRKNLNLNQEKLLLLKQVLSKEEMNDFSKLNLHLKDLKIKLIRPRPLDEAISSSGGILLDEVDHNMMLKKVNGFFVIGEMLNWEAPTGGYLLQGCFSTAFRVVNFLSTNKANNEL